MATVDLSDRARIDLERIFDFLAETDPGQASEAYNAILDAFDTLQRHPLIGSPEDEEQRKLVISYGRTGHVALYHYDRILDAVLVTTLRHQCEAGIADLP